MVAADFYEYGGTDRPWSAGDNVNLAVGQGDLQANPLQMAVAYAAIANGGTVVRPHVGMRVEDASAVRSRRSSPPQRRTVEIEPEWQRAIMDGLHDAAMAPDGTSYNVFGGYPGGGRGQDRDRRDAARASIRPGMSLSLPTTIRNTSSR